MGAPVKAAEAAADAPTDGAEKPDKASTINTAAPAKGAGSEETAKPVDTDKSADGEKSGAAVRGEENGKEPASALEAPPGLHGSAPDLPLEAPPGLHTGPGPADPPEGSKDIELLPNKKAAKKQAGRPSGLDMELSELCSLRGKSRKGRGKGKGKENDAEAGIMKGHRRICETCGKRFAVADVTSFSRHVCDRPQSQRKDEEWDWHSSGDRWWSDQKEPPEVPGSSLEERRRDGKPIRRCDSCGKSFSPWDVTSFKKHICGRPGGGSGTDRDHRHEQRERRERYRDRRRDGEWEEERGHKRRRRDDSRDAHRERRREPEGRQRGSARETRHSSRHEDGRQRERREKAYDAARDPYVSGYKPGGAYPRAVAGEGDDAGEYYSEYEYVEYEEYDYCPEYEYSEEEVAPPPPRRARVA